MKRSYWCSAVIALLLVVSFYVGVAVPESDMTTLSHYYLSPNPKAVPDLMGRVDSVAAPMSDSADWPVGMFLAEIFARHPEVAQALRARRDEHSVRGRYTIALAARQAHIPDYTAFVEYMLPEESLKGIREEMFQKKFPPLGTRRIRSEIAIDALWGGFMASGNTAYVEKIIAALGYSLDEKGQEGITLLQGAARWSLVNTAIDHPLVLQTCRKARDSGTLPAATQDVLIEVIQEAEERIAKGKFSFYDLWQHNCQYIADEVIKEGHAIAKERGVDFILKKPN